MERIKKDKPGSGMCSVVVMIPSEFCASQVTGPGEAEFNKNNCMDLCLCSVT